jgi:hypothetical protein
MENTTERFQDMLGANFFNSSFVFIVVYLYFASFLSLSLSLFVVLRHFILVQRQVFNK